MHILFWVLLFFLCGCGNANNKKMFIEIYSDFAVQNNMKAVALIYLDADDVPELLSLENNEYRVYTLDKAEVKEINISEKQIVAKAYGKKHDFEDVERLTFFWFEYVPYKGLIRVHESDEQGRSDYYLTYRDGLFETELIASSSEYVWRTTDGKKEISNEEFLEQLSVAGYDDLVPCEYLYSGIEEAYENKEIGGDENIFDLFCKYCLLGCCPACCRIGCSLLASKDICRIFCIYDRLSCLCFLVNTV